MNGMIDYYSLTDEKAIENFLTNPPVGSRPILPDAEEATFDKASNQWQWNPDGGQEKYLNRVFEDNPNEKIFYERFDREVQGDISIGDMVSTGITQFKGMTGTVGRLVGITGVESALGRSANEIPYVSQEDYQRRRKSGETPEEIFPHLTEEQNAVFPDYIKHANKYFPDAIGSPKSALATLANADPGSSAGVIYTALSALDALFPQEGQTEPSLPPLKTNPIKPDTKLKAYTTLYDAGGEVDEKGYFRNPDGSKSLINRLYTTDEWSTTENFERRKREGGEFSDGIIKRIKQNIIYDFAVPVSDSFLLTELDKQIQFANSPEVQALQKWGESVTWENALSEGQFTKKVSNALLQTAPSYAYSTIVGTAAYAGTRNPKIAANVAGAILAALDSSELFFDAYNYALSKGMTKEEAMFLAMENSKYYAAGSFILERLPFLDVMRKIKKSPTERAKFLNNTFSKNYRAKVDAFVERFPTTSRTMQVMQDFGSEAMRNGIAESSTEISQYALQLSLQAGDFGGYKKDETLRELADVNEALDLIVGSALLGGGTGTIGMAARNIKSVIDKDKDLDVSKTITDETPIETPTIETETIETPITDTKVRSASPISVPINNTEYAQLIYDKQIADSKPINTSIVNLIKSQNLEKTDQTNLYFKHQKKEFAGFPYRKFADIVKKEGNFNFLNEANIPDEAKKLIESRVAIELKKDKKSRIAPTNRTERERITAIPTEQIVEDIKQGKGFEDVLAKQQASEIEAEQAKAISERDADIGQPTQEEIDIAGEQFAVPEGVEIKSVETEDAPATREIPEGVEIKDTETVAVDEDSAQTKRQVNRALEASKLDDTKLDERLNFYKKRAASLKALKSKSAVSMNEYVQILESEKAKRKEIQDKEKPKFKTSVVTPENVTSLKENEVFVFGSNTAGRHGKGAARTAYKKFGAIYGQGEGLQGQSYALPTKGKNIENLSIEQISKNIDTFIKVAKDNPDKTFYLTKIGTGLGNKTVEQMAELINKKNIPDNVIRPIEFMPKDDKQLKQIVKESTQKVKFIKLEESIEKQNQEILSKLNLSDISEAGNESITGQLTSEQNDSIGENVKDTETQLKNQLCINKKKGS